MYVYRYECRRECMCELQYERDMYACLPLRACAETCTLLLFVSLLFFCFQSCLFIYFSSYLIYLVTGTGRWDGPLVETMCVNFHCGVPSRAVPRGSIELLH